MWILKYKQYDIFAFYSKYFIASRIGILHNIAQKTQSEWQFNILLNCVQKQLKEVKKKAYNPTYADILLPFTLIGKVIAYFEWYHMQLCDKIPHASWGVQWLL